MSKNPPAADPGDPKVVLRPSYQGTIIRYSFALILFLFGVEIFTGASLPQGPTVSLSLINLNFWTFSFLPDISSFLPFGSLICFSLAILFAVGLFNRLLGGLLAIVFLLGVLADPYLFSSPLTSLFKASFLIALTGCGLSLFFSGPGSLSFESLFSRNRVLSLTSALKATKNFSRNILRYSLSLFSLLIFTSAFAWLDENNLIWSYFFTNFSSRVPFISFPIIVSIIGTIGVLLILGVATRAAALCLGVIFLLIVLNNGLPAYPSIAIIGSSFALISAEERRELRRVIRQQIRQHQQNKLRSVAETKQTHEKGSNKQKKKHSKKKK